MSDPQQPQPVDPCVSISDEIRGIEKTISDDRIELSHFPEDLTADQKKELNQEIESLSRRKRDLEAELAQCRERHSQGGIAEAVPAETGWDG